MAEKRKKGRKRHRMWAEGERGRKEERMGVLNEQKVDSKVGEKEEEESE